MGREEQPVQVKDFRRLAHNAAAISGDFHVDSDYTIAYDRARDVVGGFPGLWSLCAQAALIVTSKEEDGSLDFEGEGLQWIEFVSSLTNQMLDWLVHGGGPMTDRDIEGMIVKAEEAARL